MIATVVQAGFGGYVILFLGVAASWIGIPIVGAAALAAAGVLATDGELNIWLVIAVATFAAWTGGYVGYWLGWRAGVIVKNHEGRWRRQRRQMMTAGERVYRRWGRLGVFLTPTWVSGALRMPRRSFLVWNAVAAFVSTCVAAFGAYGIGAAVIGRLSVRRGILELVIAAVVVVILLGAVIARRRSEAGQRQRLAGTRDGAGESQSGGRQQDRTPVG